MHQQIVEPGRAAIAAGGLLPPGIARGLTSGEIAVLRLVAGEVRRKGHCDTPQHQIASTLDVGIATVEGALQLARRRGLLSPKPRISRNAPPPLHITIIDTNWLVHLGLGTTSAGG